MIQIDIDIPRPWLTLSVVSGIAAFVVSSGGFSLPALGGSGTMKVQAEVVRDAEEDVKKLRLEQEVLSRREEILRADLESLEEEQRYTRDPAVTQELNETRQRLIGLIQDQRKAEQEILISLRQIWEAQGYAMQASRGSPGGTISLVWPVEPELGISARFEDDGYEARFGIPHHAIDLPVAQGSPIVAAADGTVVKVSDNGMGFNSLVIRHRNGFATMYGHVTEFLVAEGDVVSAGDPIALSGGRPGTKGAGRMTTGAHLHLELLKDGQQVDPLKYLPAY